MDFATPPSGLAAWLLCLGCFLWIVNSGIKLARGVRGARGVPPNEQLQYSHEQLTRRVDRLETQLTSISQKLEQDKTDLLLAGEQRAEKIHARINNVLEAVSELRGKISR